MPTNFNISPYMDDFDSTKNFHKICFTPGVAVQARELTQSQSILQDQIKKFGDHIFKNYSVVYGGGITSNFKVQFLKLEELDINSQTIDVNNFLENVIKDSTGTISAKVLHVFTDECPVLVLSYYSAQNFSSGDVIYTEDLLYNGKVIAFDSILLPATGKSSICSIDSGVFYIDGYFVEIPKQTITIDEYSNYPSARIGLSIEESFVTSDEDTSLLDPALGASNFQAPGADRYKIALTLTKKSLELDADTTFIELLRISEGKILKSVQNTQYSEIDKYFARRTSETNGNFIVDKFNVTVSDPSANGSSNVYNVVIGPGKAYVNGFIFENQSALTITANKARDYNSVENKSVFMNYGNYIYLDNVKGLLDQNSFQEIDFHVVKSANTANTQAYNSTLAARGKVKNLKFFGYTNSANSSTYSYETYVIDIQNNVATANALSINRANTITNTSANIAFPAYFSSSNSAYVGVNLKINSGADASDVIKISAYRGDTKVASLANDFKTTPEGTCNFSLLFDTKDFESIYNSNTSVVGAASNTTHYALITTASKVDGIDSGDVYFRNADDQGLIYELGNDYIVPNSIQNSEYYSWMKFNNYNFSTAMQVPGSSVFVFMGNDGIMDDSDAASNFIVVNNATGNIIPFSTANAKVSISASSTQAQLLDYTVGGLYNSLQVSVYAKTKVRNGNIINYTRKTKTLVTGNTAALGTFSTAVTGKANTYVDSTTSGSISINALGQTYIKNSAFNTTKQSLYVSDVKQILKVIDTRNETLSAAMLSSATYDVTRYYIFDNGQTDHYYGHSSIKAYANAPVPVGDILVIYDYYYHSGNGYFDAQSYIDGGEPYENIPSYTNTKGIKFELRDCVDFRKTRSISNESFSLDLYGDRPTGIPVDGTTFETDYSYYLGRKDLLIISKDNEISYIEGNSSLNPVEPNQPDGSMTISKFNLDPYTLRVKSDNRGDLYSSVKQQTMIHKRWRMEDITSLEDRVSRVEYYTTLNSLEQSAKNLQIPDETGINRFKNGILTDDFSSYIVSDVDKEDFHSSIQTAKNRLFSVHNVKNFDLTLKDAVKSFGKLDPSIKSGLDYNVDYSGEDAYITLPYEKVPAATQPYASSVVNVNPFNVIDIEGDIDLSPTFDAWVSTTKLPDIDYTFKVPQSNTVNSTTSGDWQLIQGADKNSGNIVTNNSNQEFDGFVTDASLYPWIRDQQISFTATALAKNTPVACFFDGNNVSLRIRESNKINIDTNNLEAFSKGSVLGYSSGATYIPFGKILSSHYTGSYVSGTETRYYMTCSIIYDVDAEYYINENSNIASLYFNSTGVVSATVAGTGILTGFSRKSGRIISQPTANTIVIKQFYDGEANTISIGTDSLIIIDELSERSYMHSIVSATANTTANTITLQTIIDPFYNEITFNNLSTAEKKRFIYTLRSSPAWVQTDDTGSLSGVFYLPKDTYHTGDRIFRIDNRVAGNIGTETTFAETTFFASNLRYNKRGIDFSIDIPPPTVRPPDDPKPPPEPPPPSSCLEANKVVVGWSIKWKPASALVSYGDQFKYAIKYNIGRTKTEISKPSTFSIPSSYTTKTWEDYTRLEPYILPTDKSKVCYAGKWYQLSADNNTYLLKTYRIDIEVNIEGGNHDDVKAAMAAANASDIGTSFEDTKVYPEMGRYYYDILGEVKDCGPPANFTRVVHYDPVCQSFIFYREEYPYGCFVKSIKVFFRNKPTSEIPISCSITDTLNGYPTKVDLPHAKKILNPSQVKVSVSPHVLDDTTYTEFVFDIPVYMKPETMYAFMLKSDSNEYEVYTARLGDFALPSTTRNALTDLPTDNYKISTTPYIGELFLSQNSLTWSADPNQDLMFRIERCDFDITQNPIVEFVVPEYLPQRKLMDNAFDFTYGANTNFGAAFTANTDFVVDAFDVSTTDLTFVNAPIRYSYKSTYNSTREKETTTTYISPGRYGSSNFQEIMLDDGKGERVLTYNLLPSGAYSYSLYADLQSTDSTISPMISEMGLSLFGIQWKINNLEISNNDIRIINGGNGYSNIVTTMTLSRTSNTISSNVVVGTTAMISPVVDANGTITSITINSSGSHYASNPIITITDPNRVGNVNASIVFAGETSSSGGNGIDRYITKPVTLAAGFDAGDLRVYYTAYRPINTNIYVYYKILNRNDNQLLDDSDWQLMTTISGASTYSTKRDQVYEYVAAPYREPYVGIASNKVSYISKTSGLEYTNFYKFAIKIVKTSSDPTTVPYLKDVRGIALLPIG